jgi:hypothetical protein
VSAGIGFVDAHLIASTLITPHTLLWWEQASDQVAKTLGLKADLS